MGRDTVNWRDEILKCMSIHEDSPNTIIDAAPSWGSGLYDVEFDSGYGGNEGIPFAVWTYQRVYFPACYDGAEWVESVPRYPDGQPIKHIGGG